MVVGEKIKELLVSRGKSAEFLAGELGISPPTVYAMYRKDSIESKYLKRIAEVFDLSVTYFFDEEAAASSSNVSGDGNVTLTNALTNAHIGGDLKNKVNAKKNLQGTHDCSALERLLEEKERVIEEKERVIDLQYRMIENLEKQVKSLGGN